MKNLLRTINNSTFLGTFFSVIFLIILGIIDWKTGYEISFQFFYFIPLTIIAYNIKLRSSFIVAFAIATSLIWFLADYFAQHIYSNNFLYFWNTFSRFVIFSAYTLFLNSLIKQRTKINLLNKELSNRDFMVTESIRYAKTIQDSIIPSFNDFKSYFPNSFILNKPKDILGGDFFWYLKKEREVCFALIDCTGHGVPGSLLSIISNDLLDKIVSKPEPTTNIGEILTQLHEELVKIFSSGKKKTDDGFEIALIRYNESTKEISISQTSQSALIMKPDGTFVEFESHGYTIGGMLSKRKGALFSSDTIKFEQGSWLYLYSDGLIDQFGSINNIKLDFNNFTELLKSVQNLSANEQFNIISNKIEKWKGDYKQIDDITLVGIEL